MSMRCLASYGLPFGLSTFAVYCRIGSMNTYRRFATTILIMLCLLVPLLSSCGKGGTSSEASEGPGLTSSPPADEQAIGIDMTKAADANPILVTDFDLDELLSAGLPVVLNFGDGSDGALSTLEALAIIHRDLGEHVLIRSVDLAAKPDAREGYPVQVMPTQFFYAADGTPIPLNVNAGVIMSGLYLEGSMEPVFTIHEGPLTLQELIDVLSHMGAVSLL